MSVDVFEVGTDDRKIHLTAVIQPPRPNSIPQSLEVTKNWHRENFLAKNGGIFQKTNGRVSTTRTP